VLTAVRSKRVILMMLMIDLEFLAIYISLLELLYVEEIRNY